MASDITNTVTSAVEHWTGAKVNEYQEALNRLSHNAYQSIDNKWKYGLGIIDKSEIIQHKKDVSTLEELVERSTPKSPVDIIYNTHGGVMFGKCPVCGRLVVAYHACPDNDCRQAIKWCEDETTG